jgi:hypothetical protein
MKESTMRFLMPLSGVYKRWLHCFFRRTTFRISHQPSRPVYTVVLLLLRIIANIRTFIRSPKTVRICIRGTVYNDCQCIARKT